MRDKRNLAQLWKDGWQVEVIWECESRKPELVGTKLTQFLFS